MIFTAEENPLAFICKFESAVENSTEEDLKFNLLDFVFQEDEKLFRQLYMSSTWPVMRAKFLSVYAEKYTRTKLDRMNVPFPSEDFVGLHDYFMYMFEQYSKFTTIQKTDQIVGEVLLRLPPEVNELFITREKLFKDKSTILDFCKVLDAETSDLHCPPEETASSQGEPYDPPEDQDEQSDLTSNPSDDQSVDSNESSRPQAARSKGRGRAFLEVPKIRITKPTKGKSKKRASEEDSDEFSGKEGRAKKRTNNTLSPISESEETSSRSNSESSASSSVFRYRTRSKNQIESETSDKD